MGPAAVIEGQNRTLSQEYWTVRDGFTGSEESHRGRLWGRQSETGFPLEPPQV